MSNIINKFLLAGEKILPGTHFRQPGLTYNVCGHSQKIKEEYKSSKKQETLDISFKIN